MGKVCYEVYQLRQRRLELEDSSGESMAMAQEQQVRTGKTAPPPVFCKCGASSFWRAAQTRRARENDVVATVKKALTAALFIAHVQEHTGETDVAFPQLQQWQQGEGGAWATEAVSFNAENLLRTEERALYQSKVDAVEQPIKGVIGKMEMDASYYEGCEQASAGRYQVYESHKATCAQLQARL